MTPEEIEARGRAHIFGIGMAVALLAYALFSSLCRADEGDPQTRVALGAAGSALVVEGSHVVTTANSTVPVYEGTVYTGTRKGGSSTYSPGDTDIGSTTRNAAVRGREKGTRIVTEHRVTSVDPADLTRVERGVQARVPNTSRPAVPPNGASMSTPATERAADDIVEAIRRGATSTAHDLRTIPQRVASECAARPKACANAGKAMMAGGAALVAGALLIPDPTDIVLVEWCDNGHETCPDGTRQCRNLKCAGHGQAPRETGEGL